MGDTVDGRRDTACSGDPIIRSLLDTDFYKFLMLQLIWQLQPDARVTFALQNRSKKIRLAESIDLGELIEQLDHARSLRFTRDELDWLAGKTVGGGGKTFRPDFIGFLRDFRLPQYRLEQRDGQFELRFDGLWAQTTMWEVPCLAILSELRARAFSTGMSRYDRDLLYAQAKRKLRGKIERLQRLKQEGPLRLGDFGTRRRHGFLWQRWCIETLRDGIGESFAGTSNVRHAYDLGCEPIGTNAHELPMVFAAQAKTDEDLRRAPFAVLEAWQQLYAGDLLVLLPDTFGTRSFLESAPDWAADWVGARPDSKPPIAAAEELIAWWEARGRNPSEKRVILSDAMTIGSIEDSVRALRGRVGVSIGWGTALTNDLVGCSAPAAGVEIAPASLVCKVIEVDDRPAVKLSDNPEKLLGPPGEIDRYVRVFDYERARKGD